MLRPVQAGATADPAPATPRTSAGPRLGDGPAAGDSSSSIDSSLSSLSLSSSNSSRSRSRSLSIRIPGHHSPVGGTPIAPRSLAWHSLARPDLNLHTSAESPVVDDTMAFSPVARTDSEASDDDHLSPMPLAGGGHGVGLRWAASPSSTIPASPLRPPLPRAGPPAVFLGAAFRADPERAVQLAEQALAAAAAAAAVAASAQQQQPPAIFISLKDVVSAGEMVEALRKWQEGDLSGLIDAADKDDVGNGGGSCGPHEVCWELMLLLKEHPRHADEALAHGVIDLLEEMLVLPAAPTLALLCDPMHITAAARRGARRSLGGIADLLHLLKLAASVVLELCRYRHGAAAVATSTLPQALLFPAATARTLANGSWSLHFFLDAGADSEAPTHPYSHYADAQHVGVDALSRCLAVLPPGSDARHALACTVAQWACFSPLPVHTPAELVRAATALIALAVSIMQPAGACEPLVLGGVGTEGE